MIGATPMCTDCKHFKRTEDGLVCDAYPDGIPDAIIDGDVNHRKPYQGDNGIQFALKDGEKPKDWWPR